MTSKEECPICFTTDAPLLLTPCNHSACKSCLERVILSTTAVGRDYINEDMETVHDCIITSCPTRGRCPLCRQYINMFDLKYDHCYVIPPDDSTSTLLNEQNISEEEIKQNSDIMVGYAYDQNICMKDTPLAGMVFVPRGKKIGQQSIHFPPHEGDSSGNDGTDESDQSKDQVATNSKYDALPYISFETIDEDHKLDNGIPIPKRKYFDFGSLRFHDKSKTFAGDIDWTMGDNGSTWKSVSKWEVIAQFSSDYRLVTNGCFIKKRADQSDETVNWNPLDGWWTVEWQSSVRRLLRNDEPQRDRICVIDSAFTYGGIEYNINIGNLHGDGDDDNEDRTEDQSSDNSESRVHFLWPFGRKDDGSFYKQVIDSGWDRRLEKDGPEIGGVIIWKVDYPQYERIVWTRETRATPPEMSVNLFGFSKSLRYERYAKSETRVKPSYHSESVWGNVFVQGCSVGYASYHFFSSEDDGDEVYISYEHPRCGGWPPLDDGSPVPSRVPFIETSFDESTRTFCGTIPWLEVYNTTWQGCEAWRYEMVFDSEYSCILRGSVVVVNNNGERLMSTFGSTLAYVNAALIEKINAMIEDVETSTREIGIEKAVVFRNVKTSLTRRLEDEGASPRTLNDINRIAIGVMNSELCPIDYNLS